MLKAVKTIIVTVTVPAISAVNEKTVTASLSYPDITKRGLRVGNGIHFLPPSSLRDLADYIEGLSGEETI